MGVSARAHAGWLAGVAEEDGFVSPAVAVALLVCLSLTMSLATMAWVQNRSADVQSVADASALAGANVVGAYATTATVLDACVLTMGVGGMVALGAGLVASAVPGMSVAGAQTLRAGSELLDARREFATTSAKGLRALESTLPLAIAVRSAAAVQANASGAVGYVGCAIPFPQASESDFSSLGDEVSADGLEEVGEDLGEASDAAEQAKKRLDAAVLEGWLADCGDAPRNLRERAERLAGLDVSSNPSYASPQTWSFGAPLLRARSYYASRLAKEAPASDAVEERANSAIRRVFYAYALAEVRAGRYEQLADGRVVVELSELPATTDAMRATRLYTDEAWPCSVEPSGMTLHAFAECPGATGSPAGSSSLAALEAGSVVECGVCRMDAAAMGGVASASTNIDNGFEHFWRRVVDASREYEAACEELADAQAQTRELAQQGSSLFGQAISALAVPRPKLCPPGAWGCVAVVAHGEVESPPGLSQAFASSATLPAGAAVSAAVLAPDEDTDANDVITRLFGAMADDLDGAPAGVLGTVGELWGSLLVGYGSAADGLSSASDDLIARLEGVPLGSAAAWLKEALCDAVVAAGFAPADLRVRKPVLTNSQNVLDQAGATEVSSARDLVERLPASGGAADLARALGQEVANELGGQTFTVAEIPIPGTDIRIPLTIDVGELLGVGS